MAAMQKVFCSIAPQRKIDLSVCTYIFGVGKKMGRFINCFAMAILKLKMAIGSNLVSPERVVIGK